MKAFRTNGCVYLIIREDNQFRLCQDNRWRGMALFGTTQGCVKEYKQFWAAIRKAKQVTGIVVAIPKGYSVDAGGNVFDENTQKQFQITEFTKGNVP